jgi:outer membrane protein OmpA-like peptidoglycan-associated protein
MRLLLLVAVLMVSSCGSKAKPAEEPEPERKRTVTTTDEVIEVIDYTHFAPDSAEITDGETDVLDAVASTLEGNPDITKVEVQGHADASEQDPAGIAQARADAVVAYLVAKGIAVERLVARGYAADVAMPPEIAADQASANRTVGYLILERSGP